VQRGNRCAVMMQQGEVGVVILMGAADQIRAHSKMTKEQVGRQRKI
jgi:hypothetical protein